MHAKAAHVEHAARTERSPAAGRWILAATILGSSMVFINGSTVNVALPALQRTLGASVGDIQWIVNAYTLFLAALLLLGGSMGDRYGRRRVFVAGVIIFALASIACGLAPTSGWLIGARAIQGIGGALLTPGSLAIISASFDGGARGRAIGLWSGFTSLTAAGGPLLGGWLIDNLSWRWIFFMLVPLAALTLIVTLWRVPESRDEEATGGLDWWGAALATLGLAAVIYGLISASARGVGDAAVMASIGGGAALLLAFVAVETRAASPMMPPELFRSRAFSGANLLTLFLYTALGGALFFLPLNLQQVQGYSATAAGAAFLPMILLISLLSSWAGGLVDSVGARLPLVIGPLIVMAGFVLMAVPGIGGGYWLTWFPALVVLGVGMAVSVAPLTTTVMDAVPNHFAGTASGVNNAVSRVASLFAIAALGLVVFFVFSSALDSAVAPLALSSEAQQALDAQKENLAAAQPPASLSVAQQAMVDAAIDRAFVRGFRVVMLVAAALAALSAAVAWLTIEGKRVSGTKMMNEDDE